MIIETSYKDGDTVSFKLASGEEIVARLDKETNTSFKISKPMVLIVQADESMGLAPFMFSVGEECNAVEVHFISLRACLHDTSRYH